MEEKEGQGQKENDIKLTYALLSFTCTCFAFKIYKCSQAGCLLQSVCTINAQNDG